MLSLLTVHPARKLQFLYAAQTGKLTVIDALIRQARKLPRELYRSLTWDRGKDIADHQRFSLATDIKVYFCDPKSPWQRGSNEQINGLLRQYFPKGMDPVGSPPKPPECRGKKAQRTIEEDSGLLFTSRKNC